MLRFSVDSALTYKCTETTAEDWEDMPENTAKLIIELQAHQKAVSEHLKQESEAETTKALREYTQGRFDKNEENLETHKDDTD